MCPLLQGDIPTQGLSPALHSAWHSPASLARAPGRKQEPFVPQAGSGNQLPTKGSCWCARGDPAPGSVPRAPSQAALGAVCPHSPVQDADTPLLPLQIYPDPELEAQVLSLAIRCIHSEEGCRWSGLIKHLQVGPGRMGRAELYPEASPSPSLCPPGPSWHLWLQRDPLPQPVQRQAEPPGPPRARPARLPQAQGQVRVLRQRLHWGGLRGGHWGGHCGGQPWWTCGHCALWLWGHCVSSSLSGLAGEGSQRVMTLSWSPGPPGHVSPGECVL